MTFPTNGGVATERTPSRQPATISPRHTASSEGTEVHLTGTGPNPGAKGFNVRATGLNPRATGSNTRRTGSNTRRTEPNTRRTGPNARRTGSNPRATGPNARRPATHTPRTACKPGRAGRRPIRPQCSSPRSPRPLTPHLLPPSGAGALPARRPTSFVVRPSLAAAPPVAAERA
jgi:hypothetical protein